MGKEIIKAMMMFKNARLKKTNGKRVLILTGTINPDVFKTPERSINVKLTNVEERLDQYKKAIKRYIEESIFTNIVFVENSGYDFDVQEIFDASLRYNKQFEFIRMSLSETQISNMLKKGKSYGESLLIDFAIKNSTLVKGCDEIWKVTGRLYVNNINKIVTHSTKGANEAICNNPRRFIKYKEDWPGQWIHTEFFKILKTDYLKYFENNWELCDDYKDMIGWRSQHCIEQVWYQIAKDNHIRFKNFCEYPQIEGILGSANRKYETPFLQLQVKNILCKVGFYSIH